MFVHWNFILPKLFSAFEKMVELHVPTRNLNLLHSNQKKTALFPKESSVSYIVSGQIIIFHQPGFPWNKGISLTKPPFGVRSCEVAIIWPDCIYIYLEPNTDISCSQGLTKQSFYPIFKSICSIWNGDLLVMKRVKLVQINITYTPEN